MKFDRQPLSRERTPDRLGEDWIGGLAVFNSLMGR